MTWIMERPNANCWDEPSEEKCYDFYNGNCEGYPGKPCVVDIMSTLREAENATGQMSKKEWNEWKDKAVKVSERRSKNKFNRSDRVSDKYHILFEKNRLWEGITWLGVPMWKLPNDAIIVQEIIYETKPEAVIETGTGHGGSALFYASVLRSFGNGRVLTVDIKNETSQYPNYNAVARIMSFIGSSTNPLIVKKIKDLSAGRVTMVILDSFHSKEHVLKELELYSDMVTVGNYLIVEDTHVNGNPVPWEYEEGPMEAVKEFLKKDDRFEIDKSREKLVMTFCPNGFLKKIKG